MCSKKLATFLNSIYIFLCGKTLVRFLNAHAFWKALVHFAVSSKKKLIFSIKKSGFKKIILSFQRSIHVFFKRLQFQNMKLNDCVNQIGNLFPQ